MVNRPKKQEAVRPIDKLDLSKANRVRARITRVLGGVLAVGAVSSAVGAGSGKYVQGEYREWSGYDPNQTSEVAEDEVMTENTDEDTESEKKGPEGKETWMENAKRIAQEKLDKAKKWASKEADKKIDKLPIVKEYREAVKKLNELHRKALEAGDQIAFWGPFIIMFLATLKFASLAIRAKRGVQKILDPEKSKKHDATQGKVNEMIDRENLLLAKIEGMGKELEEMRTMMNTLAANGRTGMPPKTLKRIEGMSAEFNEVSGIIDVGLADESGPVKKVTA